MSWRTLSKDRPFANILTACELYSVVFIFDYIQLLFNRDGTSVIVYSKCSIVSDGQSASQGEKRFADLLTALIGQSVDRIDCTDGVSLILRFISGATVSISLIDDDQVGPEAAVIKIPGQPTIVI